jgi:hypothetical protein
VLAITFDFDNDSLEDDDVDNNDKEEDFIQDYLYNINNQATSPFTKGDFKSAPSKSIAGSKSRGTCMASFYLYNFIFITSCTFSMVRKFTIR